MVFGFVRLGLATAQAAIKGAPTVTKTAVKTLPQTARPTGWGAYAKTGVIGGSIGAAGLGISSAVDTAQDSIQEGGHGLLVVGGIVGVIILLLFLLLRRK